MLYSEITDKIINKPQIRVNPRNPRHPRSIRLDEYHILYPDNHANNTVLSLSCCNTYGKEEADANFAVVF
jgi:hypothetical protein